MISSSKSRNDGQYFLQSFNFSQLITEPTKIKYRDCKHFLFLQNLIESDISRVQNIACVDQTLDVWNKTLLNVLDKSAPIKNKSLNNCHHG